MIRNLRRVHIGSSRRQCRTPTLSTVDDDRTTSSSSLSSSFAWGAAAAAAAALSSNDDTPPFHRQWSNSNGRRGYGTTTAFCEAPKQPNKSSSSVDKSNDSFFDMAQQWARRVPTTVKDKLPNSNVYANNNIDVAIERKSTGDILENNSNKHDSATSNPLASLLDAMGILGGATNAKTDGINIPPAVDEHVDSKGTMHRMKHAIESSLHKVGGNVHPEQHNNNKAPIIDESNSVFADLISFANSASMFTRKSSGDDIEGLIQQAQRIVANQAMLSSSSSSDDGSSLLSPLPTTSSYLSQIMYFQQNAKAIQRLFESFNDAQELDLERLFPANPVSSLHYYLEYEDAKKTPSWKRRIHRFHRSVDVMKVNELNEALHYCELSYADSVEDIRSGLATMYHHGRKGGGGGGGGGGGKEKKNDNLNNKPQWELLFCDTESRPNEPSHFLAIQKNALPYDDVLHVLMVVRGTKSMSDLITDAMMEASDYEYAIPGVAAAAVAAAKVGEDSILCGKAHSGMQLSGKYLVNRHHTLLSTLLKLSKKRKIEITLIGHSLGAGAATIAAMEWNTKPFGRAKLDDHTDAAHVNNTKNDIQVSAHVIGFGCPALLSKNLSLVTKEYVTTVIADADFIPRMSGATLVNLLLDVKNFDYRKEAERDIEQALREVQSRISSSDDSSKSMISFNIGEDNIQSVMGYIRRGMETVTTNDTIDVQLEGKQIKKKQPVLFPPGDCIHFYRDGSGISGAFVPCDFFNEVRSCVLTS